MTTSATSTGTKETIPGPVLVPGEQVKHNLKISQCLLLPGLLTGVAVPPTALGHNHYKN